MSADPTAAEARRKAEWAAWRERQEQREKQEKKPIGRPRLETTLADIRHPIAANGRPPAPDKKSRKKATCHPSRYAVSDGLCQICFAGRMMAPPNGGALQSRSDLMARFEKLELSETQYAQEIRRQLQLRLPEYVELHTQAARLAALRGDARPAEWALQTIKVGEGPVVQPVPKEGAGGGGGIKVLIGVNLGGLPPGTETSAVTVVEEKADGAKVSRPALDV